MRDEGKIGIYLCTCEGEVGKVINLDSLAEAASGLPGVIAVRKDCSFCSEHGIRTIREEVKKLGLERILIAACSPLFKAKEFTDLGVNKYLVERVNIREQCSRIHADSPENATKKAKALLRVSLEKARHSRPLQPLKVPSVKNALVVGGGEAGINAALDLAGTDVEVFPVEKKSVHPVVNILKCDRCKRCMEECPFKAYSFDDKQFPKVDITKCRVCGICMGSCPLGAISLGELSIEQLSGMLDVLDKSYLGDDEPVILGFLCKNDAYRAADDAGLKGISYPPNLISIMVPCSGAVNGMIISEAISKGVDGILIAGCHDSQCHYVQGSSLAKTRIADITAKLKEMYIEPERVRFVSINRDETDKFAETVKEHVNELKKLGRNPLRVE